MISKHNCLPLEYVKNYLVIVLEKTEKEKQFLDNECRKALQILTDKKNKSLAVKCDNNHNDHTISPCRIDCVIPSESKKHVVSKIDAAIKQAKHLMEAIENKTKSPKKLVNHGAKSSVTKYKSLPTESPVKSKTLKVNENQSYGVTIKHHDNEGKSGRESAKGRMSQRYEGNKKYDEITKENRHFVSTYKKDFVRQNKQFKNSCSSPVVQFPKTETNFNDDKIFNFRGIDDILQRVTPYPTTNKVTSVSRNVSNGKAEDEPLHSDTCKFSNCTSMLSKSPNSCNESSKQLLKLFGHCQLLFSQIKGDHSKSRNYSSSFLIKLKERNKNFTSDKGSTLNEYEISMNMVSKCSLITRKSNFSGKTNFQDTFQTFYANNPTFQNLELKVYATESMYIQLELLDILTKELSVPCQKLFYSTLFYKTCETLLNILPGLNKGGKMIELNSRM